jgi:hypothetical protein
MPTMTDIGVASPSAHGQAMIFVVPKFFDERVFDLANYAGAIIFVGKHPVDAEQGSVLTIEQGGYRVVKDVFHSRPP